MGESVRMNVQKRRVYLVDIPCKYKFCILPGSCDNCLYFVRCKILRLIYNEKNFRQAASADIARGENISFSFLSSPQSETASLLVLYAVF